MNTDVKHIELISKKQKLHEMSLELKSRFLGLDNVIDEVVSLMMPWYLFPEAQSRPTVINLWGLTGSGKTALVQSMVEVLDYKSLYVHFDMGEFESGSASWMRNTLTSDLEFFDGKPALICMDEFQFAKTLDKTGTELSKDKLRVVWELLDSGKIEYLPDSSTYYHFRAENCQKRIDRLLHANIALAHGVAVGDPELFSHIMDGFFMERYDVEMTPSYFMSDDFISGLYNFLEDQDLTKRIIREQMKTASLDDIKKMLAKGLRKRPATKTLDLSRSLLFVLGNLDEAYTMSRSMNPDISADEFHEQTSKITIADIKQALRKRFRPEQIARLGNNHVIYTSFSNAQFRLLIRRELDKVSNFVKTSFGWKVIFDESVVSVVYAEGVFPAQGTRPVLTTVRNLIEARISKMIVTMMEYQLNVETVHWKYLNETFVYTVTDKNGEIVAEMPDPVKLKLENLRKSTDPQLQAHTAVHEAGHAVLAALTLRIIPSVVVSKTASESEGFCLVNFPTGPMTKKTLRLDIMLTLGGYLAEKMIFGDEFTSSGVYQDIEQATELANKAVRKYAMGSDPIRLSIETTDTDAFYEWEKYSNESLKLIRECEEEATKILERNKLLLLKIAEYLTQNSRMEEPLIAEFVKKYSCEEWVTVDGFVTKDKYYRFNSILQSQLKQAETDEGDSIIGSLLSESKVN